MRTISILILLFTVLGFTQEQTFNGDFRYMADAPLFIDCSTGKSYPVAMEKGYLDLERAYLLVDKEPGAPLGVTIIGTLVQRPSMEGSRNDSVLIVSYFKELQKSARCAPKPPKITESTWRLISFQGKYSQDVPNFPSATIFFSNNNRVEGTDGCNGYGGTYKIAQDSISFDMSGMVSTMRFCEELQGGDTDFKKSLQEVETFEVSATSLLFFAKSGKILMIFEREKK